MKEEKLTINHLFQVLDILNYSVPQVRYTWRGLLHDLGSEISPKLTTQGGEQQGKSRMLSSKVLYPVVVVVAVM